jgi:uncharacterized repeat protein (TIGR02543 family)
MMKPVNKIKFFLPIACIALALLFACENPWMAEIIQEKTIYFDSNGGSSVPSQKLYAGDRVTKPADPVLQDHIFEGWYEDNGTFNKLYDFNFIPTHSMTLYAKWMESEEEIEPDDRYIRSVEIEVISPITGAVPNTTARAVTAGNVGYTCGKVTWTPTVSNVFDKQKEYTATVTLTAKKNYTFEQLADATINGNNVTIPDNITTTVTLSYKFPETSEKIITGIEVKTNPSNMTYTHDQSLNLNGLKITLTFKDNTTEDVNLGEYGISAEPANNTKLSYSKHNNTHIKVIVGDFSANTTKTLTLNKARPTINSPSAASITYGMKLSDSELTSTPENTPPGSFAWEDTTIMPTVINQGYNVVFTPTDLEDKENYDYTLIGWTYNNLKIVNDIGITVAQKHITVTPDEGQIKVQNKPDPEFTYKTSENLISGNFFTGKLSRDNSDENVDGNYYIMQGDLSAGNNYTIDFISNVKFYITTAAAKIGNIEYPTLNAAIAAANGTSSAPTEIVLLKDITAPEIGMTADTGYTIPSNKHIKLTVGTGGDYTITAGAGGFALFTVANSTVSLTLGEENASTSTSGTLTLSGGSVNATLGRRGVNVNGGTFVMNNNVTITSFNNNTTTTTTTNAHGGGVQVQIGKFDLKGGTIQNCSANNGGGVYITGNNCTFTMNGNAIIQGNSAANNGGGVYVSGGTFTMNGGQIGKFGTPNIAKGTDSNANGGGGVYVGGGIFYLNEGVIGGVGEDCNTAETNGGGVYVATNGTLNLGNDGIIKGNTANKFGGGIYFTGTNFTMDCGTIGADGSPNIAKGIDSTGGGGGVYFTTGTSNQTNYKNFIINGGTISYNKSNICGGGVCVYYSKFTMNGGSIQNNNGGTAGGGVYTLDVNFSIDDDTALIKSNTAKNGGGIYFFVSDNSNSNGITFTMSKGTIEGNKAIGNNDANPSGGGGVFITGSKCTFNMSGGKIQSNKAEKENLTTVHGGGVYVNSGTFNMSGDAIIQGNSTNNNGGGVYVNSGTFNMSDGYIYGLNASSFTPSGISNTATTNSASIYVASAATANYDGDYGNAAITTTNDTIPLTP